MRIELLSASHRVASFDSGVKALDEWLRGHGLENQSRNLSRVFVLISDSNEIVAFYSLTMGGVQRSDLPHSLGRGLPSVEISMVLIGRLAVALPHQGKGIGRDMLIDAVKRSVNAGTSAAARFIAVDPIDDAARAFYRHFGFRDIVGDYNLRMYISMAAAQTTLEI